MYYNEYKLEVRTKKDKETLVIKNVAVLGDSNSGKTAIFAKALSLDEEKFNALQKKGTHKSRFEDVIKA